MTRLWADGQPVAVEPGPDGLPRRFFWQSAWHDVAHIANRWRIQTGWWLPGADAARAYIKLVTTTGLLCTLYQDLRDGAWYCARVYD